MLKHGPSSSTCAGPGADGGPWVRDAGDILVVHPVPVRWLAWLLSGYVISLPVAVVACGGAWCGLRTGIALLVLAPALRTVWRDLLRRGPAAVRALQPGPDGSLRLCRADGCSEVVRLCHGSLGSSDFLWLVLQGSRHRSTLFLGRAGIDPVAWAGLRRWLRQPGKGGLR